MAKADWAQLLVLVTTPVSPPASEHRRHPLINPRCPAVGQQCFDLYDCAGDDTTCEGLKAVPYLNFVYQLGTCAAPAPPPPQLTGQCCCPSSLLIIRPVSALTI